MTAVFVVGTGRSGTAAVAKILDECDNVQFHHEYCCTHVQPLAVQYYHGMINIKQAIDELWKTHGAGHWYRDEAIWGDASNKLSWLIEPLNFMMPNAKFIHVVRDGRKVVTSFYNKLADEVYGEEDQKLLRGWMSNPQALMLPPEKKYWWNLYQYTNTRFQNVCQHWTRCIQAAEDAFEGLPDDRKMTVRLEDLNDCYGALYELMAFVGVEDQYTQEKLDQFRIPHNVHEPKNYPFVDDQELIFWSICSEHMDKYGYARDAGMQVTPYKDGQG